MPGPAPHPRGLAKAPGKWRSEMFIHKSQNPGWSGIRRGHLAMDRPWGETLTTPPRCRRQAHSGS